jgi:hypothetical protein
MIDYSGWNEFYLRTKIRIEHPENLKVSENNKNPPHTLDQEGIKIVDLDNNSSLGVASTILVRWLCLKDKKPTIIHIDNLQFQKALSMNTDRDIRELPFPALFLNFSSCETILLGILLEKGVDGGIFYSARIKGDKDTAAYFSDGTITKTNKDLGEKEMVCKAYQYGSGDSSHLPSRKSIFIVNRRIQTLICVLLDMINHPEVEVVTLHKSTEEEIQNRVRRGKAPIYASSILKISGKLKEYIYEEELKNTNSYTPCGYRYEVRGHIHRWLDKSIYKKLYSLTSEQLYQKNMYKDKNGIICKWINSFWKGKGLIVKHEYIYGDIKKKIFQCQCIMQKIISEIYPEEESLLNDRKALNGLEIDNYIPSKKIGFEYNGYQHYVFPNVYHKTLDEFEAQKVRDIEKQKRAKEKGITLITIRYDENLSKTLIENKLMEIKDGN